MIIMEVLSLKLLIKKLARDAVYIKASKTQDRQTADKAGLAGWGLLHGRG